MESRIERLCVERGLKMTGQRRVIARVLSEAADHPDVEELYRRASALDARISIATVYRTVRLLEERASSSGGISAAGAPVMNRPSTATTFI
jgi:Fur family ferric uptake transcriptional regulator